MRKFRKRRALRFLFRFYFDLVFSSLPFFHAFLVLSFVSVRLCFLSFLFEKRRGPEKCDKFFLSFFGGTEIKKDKKKTNDGLWNGRGLFSRERERERKREKKRRRAPSPSLRRVLQLQKRKEWDESPRAFTQTTTTTTTVAVVVRVSMIPTMENGRKD